MPKLHVYLTILLYFVVKNINSVEICDIPADPDVAEKVYLKLYKGNSSALTYTTALITNPQAIAAEMNPNVHTVFYVHGFTESGEAKNVLVVIKEYVDKGNVNIILVDWGKIAQNPNYLDVARQVQAVGKAVAEAIIKLAIDIDRLTLVGHSLGAHVIGSTGRNLNSSLPRLIGLDPANQPFYPSSCHINSTDAKIVAILHTNSGGFGTPYNTGTVDFYANREMLNQPGCLYVGGDVCSHRRSPKLFAESVRNSKAFPSHKCSENSTNSNDSEVVYFGDSTPENIHGEYCFSTNAQSPYGQTS